MDAAGGLATLPTLHTLQTLRADPNPLRAGLQARAAVANVRDPAALLRATPSEAMQLAWLLVLAGEADAALDGLAARARHTGEARWLAEAARLAALCGWSSLQATHLRAALQLAPTDRGMWQQWLGLVSLRDDAREIAPALDALTRLPPATTSHPAANQPAGQPASQHDTRTAEAWLVLASQAPLAPADIAAGNAATAHSPLAIRLPWLVASDQLAAAWALVAESAEPLAMAWRARLRLWSGDATGAAIDADAALASDPALAEALLVRGVCALLANQSSVAAEAFAALLAQPRTMDNADLHAEALCWQAEQLYRAGDNPAAIRAIERAVATARRSLPAAHLLRWVVAPNPPTAASVDAFVPLTRTLLPNLPAGEAHWTAVAEAVPTALGLLGHNRSGWPTRPAAGDARGWAAPAGQPLTRVWLERSPRQQCRLAQERLYHVPVDSVLSQIDAVLQACPWSPLPLAFRGELHLWLGAYPQAEADLRLALERWPWTRWAHAGLACAALQRGALAEAIEWLDLGRDRMRSEGPPWRVLRGEAALRGGDPERAAVLLEEASRVQPTRIGARWLWALALANSGNEAAALHVAQQLADGAWGLWQSALSAALMQTPAPTLTEVLQAGLLLLRGCRASSFSVHAGPDGSGARTLRWQAGGRSQIERTADAQLGTGGSSRGPR